jgi:hypothetical protein
MAQDSCPDGKVHPQWAGCQRWRVQDGLVRSGAVDQLRPVRVRVGETGWVTRIALIVAAGRGNQAVAP